MKKRIVIVAHKYLTQPDDELVSYLNDKKTSDVLHIYHSFIDAPDRKSYAVWYQNGKKYREYTSLDYKKFPEPIIYLKEMFYTLCWVLLSGKLWDTYIGMDGLCVLFGNMLRSLGRVKKTIYWAIDFVPKNRFNSGFKNRIYHTININGYKKSNEMWDLSPRMAEAREKYLGIKQTDYHSQKIVPYGMWVDRIQHYAYNDCEKQTLVFMGYLVEKQGVQLVIDAMPEIVKEMPNFKFKIIGEGAYKQKLIDLAKQRKVFKQCDFMGKIENIRELEDEVAKSALAIAPYIKKLDTWTYYADPGKVKTYLGCGVPVLLTDVPWNASDIDKQQCGKIISEDPGEIAETVIAFLSPDKNQQYRKNALQYAKQFDYANLFKSLEM